MDLDTSDLDAQIAALQAARDKVLRKADQARLSRDKEEARILIGTTPTKPAVKDVELPNRPPQPIFFRAKPPTQTLPCVPQAAPSRMSTSLAALRRSTPSSSTQQPAAPTRSSSFTHRAQHQRPQARQGSTELEVEDRKTVTRDEDSLTIIENLLPGPRNFERDPEGEEEWVHLEPNSAIRLSKRVLPHASLQEHLSGRYYLSPSLLYSVIRLSRDGATYDVPVEGDWVVIAVVAERGEVKLSGTKEEGSEDEEEATATQNRSGGQKKATGQKKVNGKEDATSKTKSFGQKKDEEAEKGKEKWKKRREPRKYINLKLCALPPRSKSTNSGPSGDALLQLLLFASDAIVQEEEEGGEMKRTYRGGSGGAYERWCNLGVGSVVAILNPRVLRPLRSGAQAPHPLTLPLALNPTSADAITLIGQARDLGCCSAQQKDGNRCTTWVDVRQSLVCEYHVHAAVQRGRAGRAEFTASTNGFSLQTRGGGPGSKTKSSRSDPSRRTGLLPSSGPNAAPNPGGGATYVVSGSTIHTHRSDDGLKHFGDEHLSEKLGRGRAEKRKRKMEDRVAEAALAKLLERDGNSGSTGAKYLAALDKGREMAKRNWRGVEGDGEEGERRRPFSASAVKRIGFDPIGRGPRDGQDAVKRLEAIASLRENPDRPIKLGRPKGLSRSNVRAPPREEEEATASCPDEEVEEKVDEGIGMVDLD